MKRNLRKALSLLLALALALAAVPALAESLKGTEPAEVNGNTFINDFITFTVDSDARLSSYRTVENGAPASRLIFGHSSGSGNYGNTSYTTVFVNGSTTRYGSDLSEAPAFNGNTNLSAQVFNGVRVEQRLTPIANTAGDESLLEWRYTYTNTGTEACGVGCRIMLDTYFNDSDDGALVLPDGSSYSNEITLTEGLPNNWTISADGLSAQGSFSGSCIMPDTMQYAEWRYEDGFLFWTEEYGLFLTEWDYQTDPSEYVDDSAFAATWHETDLAPGESIDFVMYFGIGVVTHVDPELELALNGVESVAVNGEGSGYEPDPVTLTAVLSNSGEGVAEHAYEQIVMPEGLTLATPDQLNVGNIFGGGSAANTISFTIDEISEQDRTFTILIKYGCDGCEEQEAEWTLFVPGVHAPAEDLPPEIAAERAELRSRITDDSRADLRFIFRVTFNSGDDSLPQSIVRGRKPRLSWGCSDRTPSL